MSVFDRKTILLAVLLPVLIAGMGWVVAAFRVQTYLTHKDPHLHYIPRGQQIVQADWSPEVLRGISADMVPGYPMLLALSLEIGGLSGPNWLNTLFGLAWWALLGLLAWKGTQSLWAPSLVIGVTWIVLLIGYPHNIHFLVYAFRDLPAQVFLLAAMVLLLRDRPRPLWAALVFLLGMGIREIVVLGLLGLIPGMLLWPNRTWRAKGLSLAWFMGAIGLAIAVGLLLVGGLNFQGARFLQGLDSWDPARLLGFAFAQHLWLVPVLLVPALLALRRWPSLILCWLGAGLGLTLFYSFTEWHARYSLTLLFWFGPLAGLGLAWLLERLPSRSRAWAGGFVCAVCLVVGAGCIPRLQPWGEVVLADELRAFRTQIHRHVQEGDLVTCPPYVLTAQAALWSYTRAKGQRSQPIPFIHYQGHKALFLEPTNDAAYFLRPEHRVSAMRSLEVLRSTYDVRPPGTQAAPVPVQLGEATFDLWEIGQPSQTDQSDWIYTDHKPAWLVLDLLWADPDAKKKLRLEMPQGTTRYVQDLQPGGGIKLLRLDASVQTPPRMRIRLQSESPLPYYFNDVFIPEGRVLRYSLAHFRRSSVMDFFQDGWLKAAPVAEFGLGLPVETDATMLLPLFDNASVETLAISLVWHPVARDQLPQTLYWQAGDESGSIPYNSVANKFASRIVLHPKPGAARQALQLRLSGTGPGLKPGVLFLEYGGVTP